MAMSQVANDRSHLVFLRPLLELRALAYDLLRRTFLAEPSRTLVQTLRGGGALWEFPFAEESQLLSQGAAEAAGWMSRPDAADDAFFESLHWDYTRLFVGPCALPAPPWESAYRNEERLLFQKETLDVRRAYLKYDLLPGEPGREADDRLGLELDFMFRLSTLAAERAEAEDVPGLEEVLNDQAAFLEEHLLRWVPQLTRDIVASAETGFYRGMARVLQGFLDVDLQAVREALGALRGSAGQPAGAQGVDV